MADNLTNAKWKIITHSQSKNKSHLMLVGFKPNGSRMNSIFFLAPLYNLNDANLDGSVSVLEWAYGRNIYDPYSVFELFNSSNRSCCTIDAGNQLRDFEIVQKAFAQSLHSSHKAASMALRTLMVEKLLSPGIERNLAISKLSEMGQHSDKLIFVVQIVLETIVEKVLQGGQKL